MNERMGARRRRGTTGFLTFVGLVVVSLMASWSVTTTWIVWSDSSDADLQMNQPMTKNVNLSFHHVYNTIIGPDHKKHCRRHCNPLIRNRIAYTCLHPAGFYDRQELLDKLLEISAFLCATLEFPNPKASFHPMHNHQRMVDASLDWNDFFQFSLADMDIADERNGSLDSAQIPLLQSSTPVRDISFEIPFFKRPHCRRPRAAQDRTRDKYGLHIISKDRDEVIEDFDTIWQYSFGNSKGEPQQQLPYLWEIPTNFYSFHKEFRSYIRETLPKRHDSNTSLGAACLPWSRSGRYVQRKLPVRIMTLVDDIWKEIVSSAREGSKTVNKSCFNSTWSPPNLQDLNPLIGFLHIRRGDTIEECDTSTVKLKSYLSCSLANLTLPRPRKELGSPYLATRIKLDIVLLVGTNEEHPSYMQELKTMVDGLSVVAQSDDNDIHLNVQAVDMESLIWGYLQSRIHQGEIPASFLNNLHVFEILEHIMNHRVDFKLSQRRFRFCNDCDNIFIQHSAMERLSIPFCHGTSKYPIVFP
jgi:hypothetical protein